jgi:peptidoglycan/LPS O-acetylase OafA/YrhL
MRRPLLLGLTLATLALAVFAAWFAFGHGPVSELSRSSQVAYASLLLAPPLLFLLLATALEARRHPRTEILGMLALAALVGTPAALAFLGLLGIVLELVALVLLAAVALQQHGHPSHPRSAGLGR